MGVPIVTLPAPHLRGRLTLGCYREMGFDDCIARPPQDYVQIAVRLAQEPDYHEHITGKIAARREALFENVGAVRTFENFLLMKCTTA